MIENGVTQKSVYANLRVPLLKSKSVIASQ